VSWGWALRRRRRAAGGKERPGGGPGAQDLKGWIYELIERYRAGGYDALEPGSHGPRFCPHQTPRPMVKAIVALRAELEAKVHDCGPATIAYHLAQDQEEVPSRSTIWRILGREELVAAPATEAPALPANPV
jgi:hypothetical protein